MLFEQAEAVLKEKFQNILFDFFPRYVKILTSQKYKTDIEEVRIEGHTSSEWSTSTDPKNRLLQQHGPLPTKDEGGSRICFEFECGIPRFQMAKRETHRERPLFKQAGFGRRPREQGKIKKGGVSCEDKRGKKNRPDPQQERETMKIEVGFAKLNTVLEKMGIEELVEGPGSDGWDPIDIELAGRGIDLVDPSQITVDDDGTLSYEGRKILVYIRDQYPNGGYKFHVANCGTIQGMKKLGTI